MIHPHAIGSGKGQAAGGSLLVILIILTAVAAVLATLFVPLPFDLRRTRPAMVFAAVILGSVFSILAVIFHRSARSKTRRFAFLDHAFQGVATQSHVYLRTGRRYEGTWRGRKFDAYCTQVRSLRMGMPAGVYAGEQLEIMLDTGLATRLGAGVLYEALAPVARTLNKGMSLIQHLEDRGITIWAQDAAWGANAARNAEVADLLTRLLEPGSGTGLRNVRVLPGTIMLTMRRIPPEMVNPDAVRHLFDLLDSLARVLESLPEPAIRDTANVWEQDMRKGRKRVGRIALFIVIGLLGGLTLLGAGLAFLLIWLT